MNKPVSLEIAKLLKKKGFDKQVPHCYIHNDWSKDSYNLELFSFYLNRYNGLIFEAYDEEKLIRDWSGFDGVSKISPLNESDVFFNYNQDIRRLLVSKNQGKEYMDDEKCLNFYIDSITYRSWSEKEIEDNKTLMPNYNDGDFEWGVYCDVISAPSVADVIMWIYEKYYIWLLALPTVTGNFAYKIVDVQLNPEKPIERPPYKDVSANDYNSPTEAYEDAIEYTLNKLI